MKFTEKVIKGKHIADDILAEVEKSLSDMLHNFRDSYPSEFSDELRALNEKWVAFADCVRCGMIVYNELPETTDAPESEV